MKNHFLCLFLFPFALCFGANERPNFVLIIGDDISPDFSCYDGPVQTPNIDRLAASGVRFNNAYVTASSCSPSRCSIITGRYPHNTGAPELHMDLPDGQFMFPMALKEAGYYCAQYGKFHMGDYAKQAFDVVLDVSYADDPTGAKGWVNCLQQRPKDKPFLMWFAAYDAHRPWEADPLAPPHDPAAVRLHAGIPDTPIARQDLASYYDEVRRFDRYVGGVVDELKAQGVFENTVIILLGDNGRPFPRNKTTLFDNGMRTPLVVHWPQGKLEEGATSDALVSSIDIAPAILELAGLAVPGSVQGVSLLPVCREPDGAIREVVYGEQNWHVQRYGGRMVRQGDYVYFRDFAPELAPLQVVDLATGSVAELIRLKAEGRLTPEQAELFSTNRPTESLFNVVEDPEQLNNLAGDPGNGELLEEMRSLLTDWQLQTGDSIPEVDEMTPDRQDRSTGERLYAGTRPPTGVLPGDRANAASIGYGRNQNPNILFILVDDMGYSDLGCYGSEIKTPNLDSLATNGLRFTSMYNTAKCMSSRAALLTGLYAQQCGMDERPVKMLNSATLGEVLRTAGYRTLASGKHHGTENLVDRGFDHYYGLRDGACNFWNPGVQREGEPAPGNKGALRYWCDEEKTIAPFTPEDRNFYITDAFTDRPLQWLDERELNDQPFFLYLAYTAPHYPLHAWPEDIAKYAGRYDAGYETIRKERFERMVKMGLVDPALSPLLPWEGSDWKALPEIERKKEIRRMEIYAAMLDRVDQNIGRVLNKLRAQGKLENTLILFASDNGACAEGSGAVTRSTRLEDFGTVASYEAVGRDWATVQNTPLRYWKNYSHEGGVRTPFIINWPGKVKNPGGFYHEPAHFIDIMPTLVELTGATYPTEQNGSKVLPMQGISILPALENEPLVRGKPIFWQWDVGGGVRDGDWKAVFWENKWELFDLSKDHNESHDLSSVYPEMLSRFKSLYQDWYRQSKLESSTGTPTL